MTQVVKEFIVEVENKPGALATLCVELGKSNINIKGLTVDRMGSQTFIRLVTDDETKTEGMLEKSGYMYSDSTVLIQTLTDQPKQLASIAQRLAKENINIDAVYLMGNGTRSNVAFALSNVKRGAEILRAKD